MAKIIVRRNRKVYEISRDTSNERLDNQWLEKYNILLEFQRKFGHQRLPFDETSPNYKREYVQVQRWAVGQRMKYRKGKLEEWRYNLLIKANFLFEPIATYWNRHFEELKQFMTKNGHCDVPRDYPGKLKLGKWVSEQRYHKKRLSKEQIKLLDDIGFNWGEKRTEWDIMYDWLSEYYQKHGVAYVKRDMSKGYSGNNLNRLNRWCGKQIWRYKRGKLSEERINLLKKINFDFNHSESIIEDNWETNFKKLVKFKKEFGHCNVPTAWENDKLLSYWVHRQRTDKKELSDDKIERLDRLEFAWNSFDFFWETHFQRLVEYKKEYGHCNVSTLHDKELYHWIKHLRYIREGRFAYQISEERIRRLDEIGFNWKFNGKRVRKKQ